MSRLEEREDVVPVRNLWIRQALLALVASALSPLCLAQLNIADKPLFVTAGVEPNIIAAIDDSGSMDSELLPLKPTNDGALWWNTNVQSFVGLDSDNNPDDSGVLNYNRAGGAGPTKNLGDFKKYIYLFPNGTGTGNRVYRDSSHDHYAVPPFKQFAFVRSADYNGMYYDYRIDYQPWPDEGGFVFDDVPPSAAPSDPVLGTGTLDLSGTLDSTSNNWKFWVQPGMVIPRGTRYYDDTWRQNDEDDVLWTQGAESIGVEYYPATYYVRVNDAQTYSLEDADGAVIAGNCSEPRPAHYIPFSTRPSSLTGVDALAFDGGCLQRYRIAEDEVFLSGRTRQEEMQNFANWFSYARKRHIATRSGIGRAFSGLVGIRTGAITINSRSTLNGMYSLSVDEGREDFFGYIYRRGGNSGGTPNREALHAVGEFFHTRNDVVTESCQQNFALLFTDGFSNVSNTGVGNADGNMGEPFEDDYSGTIADIAARYYNEPLGARTSEKVPVPAICATDDPPLYIDCNKKPHMVTYGVTLGATGQIYDPGRDVAECRAENEDEDEEYCYQTLRDAHDNPPPPWQNPTQTRNPVQVDDLYHAAVNSRGSMLNARTAEELARALSTALLDIVDRASSSGTSSSTSDDVVSDSLLIYSVEFRSDDWSGDIVARTPEGVDRDNDGELDPGGAVVWSAEARLAEADPESRRLYTFNGSTGIRLDFDLLTEDQAIALGGLPIPVEANDAADLRREQLAELSWLDFAEDAVSSEDLALKRIDWLRGIDVEGLRERETPEGDRRLIGDIVNSTPIYLGKPDFGGYGYADLPSDSMSAAAESYTEFLAARADRQPVLLVAANDGLFRVVDADTGDELFAYLPSELLEVDENTGASRISALMEPEFEHAFYHDGSPNVRDVYLGGQWRTLVIGTTGLGGRTVYAIDVTNPTAMDESSILWEFTDPGLGFGATDVAIAPLRDGKFYALFGNGYNSENNESELFIVDISDGTLVARVPTGEGNADEPNGLGPVEVTDWPVRDRLANFVYAGDMLGNLWRFDLSSTNPNQWDGAPDLVFEATDSDDTPQPITVKPEVSVFPQNTSEMIITFGTGSFFREEDINLDSPQIQSLYGIREVPVNQTITRDDLLVQTITFETSVALGGEQRTAREISENQYDSDGNANQQEKGWVLDLSYNSARTGERVIGRSTFPSGFGRTRVRFASLIPSDDVCAFGRSGFTFDIDLATGGRTISSVFDINEDGFFTKDDMVDGRIINAISGGSGEPPAVVQDRVNRRDLLYGGDGSLIISGDPDEFMRPGRQSWQQLR